MDNKHAKARRSAIDRLEYIDRIVRLRVDDMPEEYNLYLAWVVDVLTALPEKTTRG